MLLLSIRIVCFYLSNGFLLLWSFLPWERCLWLFPPPQKHKRPQLLLSRSQCREFPALSPGGSDWPGKNISIEYIVSPNEISLTLFFAVPVIRMVSNHYNCFAVDWKKKKEGAALLICGLEECTIYVSPTDIKDDRLKSEQPKMCAADDKLPSNFEKSWIMAQSARGRPEMKARRPIRSLHN